MRNPHQQTQRIIFPLMLALTVNLAASYADVPVNTRGNTTGTTVNEGTYYNTKGNWTEFRNPNGGLRLREGDVVRGLEVNSGKQLTGNGGNLFFNAPGAVVRVDGTIDVSGILKEGVYRGNGGNVRIDSAFLYQSGKIFANGINGGNVFFNTGAAVFAPGAQVQAMGFGGTGGTININASGVVDIRENVLFDTSGRVLGTVDSNVINIEGAAVNMKGVLKANAYISSADGHAALLVDRPNLDNPSVPTAFTSVSGEVLASPEAGRGGTVRIVANGNAQNNTGSSPVDCTDCAINSGISQGIFSKSEGSALKSQTGALASNSNGDLNITGIIEANGADAQAIEGTNSQLLDGAGSGGSGGTVQLTAARNINNSGSVSANGGKGADVAFGDDLSSRKTYAAGTGGEGGTVSLVAGNNIVNSGLIRANGGQGGNNLSTGTATVNTVVLEKEVTSSAPADSGSTCGCGGDDDVTKVETTLTTATLNNSKLEGGAGGNGGVVAFGYKGSLNNNGGTIQANGGAGGKGANASLSVPNGDAAAPNSADVSVVAGNGGYGGNGGLVVFQGPSNPTGGSIQANGGVGGQGGDATASAKSNGLVEDFAVASATADQGGEGGAEGSIVINDPASANLTTFETKGGGQGAGGKATATAEATNASAIAFANGSVGSSATTLQNGSTVPNGTVSNAGFAPVGQVDTNNLLQTAETEVISHQENLLVLSSINDDGLISLEELLDAPGTVYRTTSQPEGGDASELYDTQYRNLTIYNRGKADLDISSAESCAGDCDGEVAALAAVAPSTLEHLHLGELNTLTVLNTDGDVVNNGNWTVGAYNSKEAGAQSGGKISLIANGDILNNCQLLTEGRLNGGSINLSALKGNIVNNGLIQTLPSWYLFNDPVSAGNIFAKASGSILNNGYILSDTYDLLTGRSGNPGGIGGSIRLFAENSIYNGPNAVISASSKSVPNDGPANNSFGGSVIAKAGLVTLNEGLVAANGETLNSDYNYNSEVSGQGGLVHLHAGVLTANGPTGEVHASGSSDGGKVILSAGSLSGQPSGFGADDFDTLPEPVQNALLAIASDSSQLTDGFSITEGQFPPANASLAAGLANELPAALNFGALNVKGGSANGSIILVGDGQAGMGPDATINGQAIPNANLTQFLSDNNTTLFAGEGSVAEVICEVPRTPPGDPETPENPENPGNPSDPSDPDFNLLGLFQPNMFLAKGYTPVTEEILALALKEYNIQRARGQTVQEANRLVTVYLEQAGVDAEVAQSLIEQIQTGGLKADGKVVGVLKAMAETVPPVVEPVQPTEPGGELKQ